MTGNGFPGVYPGAARFECFDAGDEFFTGDFDASIPCIILEPFKEIGLTRFFQTLFRGRGSIRLRAGTIPSDRHRLHSDSSVTRAGTSRWRRRSAR